MRKGFTLIELMIVIAIIAIIAAIAIPNLMESRVTANEAAASASLKSGVFPGEVQFQSGGYQDADTDNVGEYGSLRALAGLVATSKVTSGSIKLLQGPLATSGNWSGAGATMNAPGLGTASGFRFTAYVPARTNSSDVTQAMWIEGAAAPALLTAAQVTAGDTENNGEKYWIAAAVPEKFGDTGRRPFLITQDGQIRSPAKAAGINVFYAVGMGGAAGTLTAAPTNGKATTAADVAAGISLAVDTGYTATTVAYSDCTASPAVTILDPGASPSTKGAGTAYWEVFAK